MLSLLEDRLLDSPPADREPSGHVGAGELPGDPRLLDQPDLRGGVRLRPHPTPRNASTPTGRLVTRTRQLPREEWAVLIPDHHPGFVSWERYERIQEVLRANWRPPRGQGGGPVREGTALLQGRLRCGRCGRMMQIGYSGTKGNCPRYICGRDRQLYGAEQGCQSLGGRRLEHRVLDEVFAMLEPAA